MKTQTQELRTLGEVARELGLPPYRIGYIVDSRRIEPSGRAGVIRLFDREALDRIRDEVAKLRAKRLRKDGAIARG